MATKMIVPLLGESINEARLIRWLKEPGDTVKRGEELAEVESGKAVVMLECPANGVLLRVLLQPGATITTGELMAWIGQPGEVPPADPQSAEPAAAPGPAPAEPEVAPAEPTRRRISPAARRRARELGLAPEELQPLVAGQRVMLEDVERIYQARMARPTAPAPAPAAAGADVPSHRVEVGETKRLTGERMLQSAREVPQFSVSADAAAQRLLAVREALNRTGGDVNLTAMLVQVAARALRRNPLLNASYADGAVLAYDTCNIAVAVATPRGLVAPVLPAAEQLTLDEIARRLRELVAAAREGHLHPQQLAGGTFTLSNLGPWGVSQFVPLVNPPQAAILGVGAARPAVLPLLQGGTQHVQLMSLTVSADHRVADGADVAQFLKDLRTEIETYPMPA